MAQSTHTTVLSTFCRVRPLSQKENNEQYRNIIAIGDEKMLVFDPPAKAGKTGRIPMGRREKNAPFAFDRVHIQVLTNITARIGFRPKCYKCGCLRGINQRSNEVGNRGDKRNRICIWSNRSDRVLLLLNNLLYRVGENTYNDGK